MRHIRPTSSPSAAGKNFEAVSCAVGRRIGRRAPTKRLEPQLFAGQGDAAADNDPRWGRQKRKPPGRRPNRNTFCRVAKTLRGAIRFSPISAASAIIFCVEGFPASPSQTFQQIGRVAFQRIFAVDYALAQRLGRGDAAAPWVSFFDGVRNRFRPATPRNSGGNSPAAGQRFNRFGRRGRLAVPGRRWARFRTAEAGPAAIDFCRL